MEEKRETAVVTSVWHKGFDKLTLNNQDLMWN